MQCTSSTRLLSTWASFNAVNENERVTNHKGNRATHPAHDNYRMPCESLIQLPHVAVALNPHGAKNEEHITLHSMGRATRAATRPRAALTRCQSCGTSPGHSRRDWPQLRDWSRPGASSGDARTQGLRRARNGASQLPRKRSPSMRSRGRERRCCAASGIAYRQPIYGGENHNSHFAAGGVGVRPRPP